MHGEKQYYYYDPETCSFVEIESTWSTWLRYGGQVVGLGLLLAGLAIWAMDAYWIATPQEQTLRAENQALERQLDAVNGRMATLSAQLDTLAERDQTLYRRLFQMDPIPEDVRQVGVGGADPYDRQFNEFDDPTADLLQETERTLDKLERQMRLQDASYRELTDAAAERQERLDQLPAIQPANGPIVSGFGMRHHPVLEVRKMHSGVDFLLRRGTPVVATGNGVVEDATQNPAYGTHVDIRHPEAGYVTRYAHLSETTDGLRPGRQIERGDTLGYSGNSGRTSGPHLHYEVRTADDEALDPTRFFAPDMTPEAYHELQERTQHADSRPIGSNRRPQRRRGR